MKNNNKNKYLLIVATFVICLSSMPCLASRSSQVDSKNADALVASLITAKSAVDCINILSDDSDFVFDFSKGSKADSEYGNTVSASRASFPAVTGQDISMTIGFMEGCSLNTPHIHPRGTEFFYSTNGTFEVGFIAENGARPVLNVVEQNQGTLFPQGSIHWTTNTGCYPAIFISGFANESPGISHIAKNFFAIDPDVVSATLGSLDVETITGIEKDLPDTIVRAINECRQRCYQNEETYETSTTSPPY